MQFFQTLGRASRLVPFAFAMALAACGGGSDDGADDVGPPSGQQQYPAGIWEGTAGTGAGQRPVIGFIDGGADGRGGEFYLARGATGSAGYDSLYGLLRTQGTALQATAVTYYSVQDGKFAQGLTLRGTVAPNPATGRAATISGTYTSPAGTAAATGAPMPFKLGYSRLNDYPARSDLIAGSYQGSGLFGGYWALDVARDGAVTGQVGTCKVAGTITPRAADSAVYTAALDFSGTDNTCEPRTQQLGVAMLRFGPDNVPSGIWVLTRSTVGQRDTYVLDGVADPRQPGPAPEGLLPAAGNWQGTLALPAGTGGDVAIAGSVAPDGGFLFYTQGLGSMVAGRSALYGRLSIDADSAGSTRFLTARDGVYHERDTASPGAPGRYTDGLAVDATLANVGVAGQPLRLVGSYNYPGQTGGFPTRFDMRPAAAYALPVGVVANVNLIVGNYRMSEKTGLDGSRDTILTVDGSGAINGQTSDGCLLTGRLAAEMGADRQWRNLYRVETLGYLQGAGGTCRQAGGPVQSGVAAAFFGARGEVVGLRILASESGAVARHAHTVFIGERR
ncbi:hypothetical protein [Melaminivora sp.]|uniref:hypothetical protein n=1 Tax=Melaminivora sp. TaxID=1933032 RepID=UPI0028A61757|nr:hypothetical protein [Melaminivora sp.]